MAVITKWSYSGFVMQFEYQIDEKVTSSFLLKSLCSFPDVFLTYIISVGVFFRSFFTRTMSCQRAPNRFKHQFTASITSGILSVLLMKSSLFSPQKTKQTLTSRPLAQKVLQWTLASSYCLFLMICTYCFD